MRYLIIPLVAVLAAYSMYNFSPASTNKSSKKINLTEVRSILEIQQNSWNKTDLEGFMKYYWNNDSLLFVTSKGATWGYKQMLAGYKKSYSSPEKIGKLNFEIHRIATIDNAKTLAHVLGKWKVSRTTDTLQGYFNIIFEQKPEGPRIIMDNTW